MPDTPAPIIATSAYVGPDSITVNGREFPYAVAAGGVTVTPSQDGPHVLRLDLLIDGPVIVTRWEAPRG